MTKEQSDCSALGAQPHVQRFEGAALRCKAQPPGMQRAQLSALRPGKCKFLTSEVYIYISSTETHLYKRRHKERRAVVRMVVAAVAATMVAVIAGWRRPRAGLGFPHGTARPTEPLHPRALRLPDGAALPNPCTWGLRPKTLAMASLLGYLLSITS